AVAAAGVDMSADSEHWASIQYQNANNSVRVTDAFMEAAAAGGEWKLTARTDGAVVETVDARALLGEIAEAAWRSADPGVQYDTTINSWHTLPNTGRINASNPCSEYMSIDDSACNLASLNLLKFRREDGELDVEAFEHAVDVVFLAQEILVGYSSYPTSEIEGNAKAYRQLGLGYANLGALLMARGLPYDSDEGRAYAAGISALMTGRAYRKSAEIAGRMGSFAGYQPNAAAMIGVIAKHRAAVGNIDDTKTIPSDLLGAYIDERNTIVGAPFVKSEHYPVFDCAIGERAVHYTGHVKMMGAIQPFISGAISKTVNMPEAVTIDDVAQVYVDAWKLGVKA